MDNPISPRREAGKPSEAKPKAGDPGRAFYLSLFPEDGNSTCRHENCTRKHIKLSVMCAKHHFEMIMKRPCPWDDIPDETKASTAETVPDEPTVYRKRIESLASASTQRHQTYVRFSNSYVKSIPTPICKQCKQLMIPNPHQTRGVLIWDFSFSCTRCRRSFCYNTTAGTLFMLLVGCPLVGLGAPAALGPFGLLLSILMMVLMFLTARELIRRARGNWER